MSILFQLKRTLQQAAVATGTASFVSRTSWRKHRLVILCYHGVSFDDEHLWNPGLYMSADLFRSRMALLKETGCTVLPLEEALSRLASDTLPPQSVTITFDDGFADYHRVAAPILREYQFPSTVYLTTYYSEFQRPVFDLMLGYLLWKASGATLDWPQLSFARVPLSDVSARSAVEQHIRQYAKDNQLSGQAKDDLLTELAARLGVNYEGLLSRRLFHIMTPEEARDLARQGVDFQLHTHRHRTSRNREWFEREIDQNRERLESLSGTRHFCYPGGVHFPEYPVWLQERGIVSATTCQPGIATPQTDRMRLPRYLDNSTIPQVVFHSWIAGFAALLPQNVYPMGQDQLLEDWLIS